MSFQAGEAVFFCFLPEAGVQFGAAGAENDVGARAVLRRDGVAVVVALVEVGIQQRGFFGAGAVKVNDAACALNPLHDFVQQVDLPGGRGVVEAVGGGVRGVGEETRHARVVCEQVAAHVNEGKACRGEVFLYAAIDDGAARPGDVGTGVVVGGGVNHQRRGGFGIVAVLDTVYGFVAGEVEVAAVGRQGGEAVRQGAVAAVAPAPDGLRLADAFGFFQRFVRPDAAVDVGGAAAVSQQVERNHVELLVCAAGQEQCLEVVRRADEAAGKREGFVMQCFKAGAAVADFHHRHAAALEVSQLGARFFEHGERQGAGAGAEVVDAVGHGWVSFVVIGMNALPSTGEGRMYVWNLVSTLYPLDVLVLILEMESCGCVVFVLTLTPLSCCGRERGLFASRCCPGRG